MTDKSFSRRQALKRFLSISAVALLPGPAAAQKTTRWRGRALGAETEITLRGPEERAAAALRAAKASLRRMERLFSLYDPESDLVRLNTRGYLERPALEFLELLHLSDEVHRASDGAFDPSIQPLWQALARGADAKSLPDILSRVGWPQISFNRRAVRFSRPGMALTFNGIAQGFATDRVASVLRAQGFADTLVNVGEFRAGAGPWRIGISDPVAGLVAIRKLEGAAIATSIPAALRFGQSRSGHTGPGHAGLGHILHPDGSAQRPLWSTVSVEAESAALADGYSTAFTLLDQPRIEGILRQSARLRRVLLVTDQGKTIELS